ncbi:MAG: helix-turn-helix domain-containing protein [Euryarchaeota archaeon]|nr:helix-turn-helix domain-containing protein [Euryarchaeota archaeon]
MIDSKIKLGGHETYVDHAVRRVKALMMDWGFAEGCSSVYAVLLTSREPLSAKDIGERTSYAYSSTINYLNMLIRVGLVERVRSIKRNVYMANVNFVELIKAEREKVMGHLKQLDELIQGTKDLEHLSEKVEHAIAYLRRLENAVAVDKEEG